MVNIPCKKWYNIGAQISCLVFLAHAQSLLSKLASSGRFCYYGLTVIPARISNHMPNKVWDGIIYPFHNFNGCTVEVKEWISNFNPHIIMGMIIYP